MTRHLWAREHLVGYLAGGLTGEERAEIQELLKSDAELAAALEELRGLDDRMRKLFVAARPPMTLEDRVIQSLRRTAAPKLRGGSAWSSNRMAVAACVAVVVVVGVVGVGFFGSGEMRMAAVPKSERSYFGVLNVVNENQSSVDEDVPYAALIHGSINHGNNFKEKGRDLDRLASTYYHRKVIDASDNQTIAEQIVNGFDSEAKNRWNDSVEHAKPSGPKFLTPDLNVPIKSSSFDLKDEKRSRLSDDAPLSSIRDGDEGKRSAGIVKRTGEGGGGDILLQNEHRNFQGKQSGGGGNGKPSEPSESKAEISFRARAEPGRPGATANSAPRLPVKAENMDSLGALITRGVDPANGETVKQLLDSHRDLAASINAVNKPVDSPMAGFYGWHIENGSGPGTLYPAPMTARPQGGENGRPPASEPASNAPALDFGAQVKFKDKDNDGSIANVLKQAFKPGEVLKDSLKKIDEAAEKRTELETHLHRDRPIGEFDDTNGGINKKMAGMADSDDKESKGGKDSRPDGEKLSLEQQNVQAQTDNKKGDTKKEELPPAKIDGKTDPKPPEAKQADPKPQIQKRVIIRSGEIDFEVDSFDQAVTVITGLIARTKGGVVSTTNSDKLANGKMRGTVVVRMPPEELDDFVMAMRRDLFKIGELKGQRIGSQDVTKHYTDMESELRGLRVSEERLIVMMKDTKAKLSDLLAVENQLAKTRTSLERIEGELRYYANLAAMSTLTINLNEKEIRVAAGVVESERVNAGVEAEDVDKAFQDAKSAIDELKGRVFKSELKQLAAGQFNAILQFDLAPESAGLMRDRLKQIGTVARLEIDRVQKVEGGGAANRESKVKRGDTQFVVSIYNLANVTPRETVNATIVGADVPASYAKLRNLVVKLKGNLRNTSMQNTDVRNVVAVLDFDIRRVDEPEMQAALTEAGEFLGRQIERSGESDNVTDRKVRFALRLISVGGITARETNNLVIAAADVPASYRKVRDAVAKAKGFMRNANLEENDKTKIVASLDFDVMRADEPALLTALADAGEILGRRVERAAESNNVTDARVHFLVRLNSVGSIAARESNNVSLAALDVPASYRKVRDAVAKAKGYMRNANLQETDKTNVSASLDFDVMRNDEPALLAAIAEAGEILTRQLDRRPEGELVTDAKIGFRVTMASVASLTARESTTLVIAATDVPAAFAKLRDAATKAKAQILTANLQENDRENMSAVLDFDVLRSEEDGILTALAGAGEQLKRQVDRQASSGKVTDAKVLFNVKLESANNIEPRDIYELHIRVDKVEEKLKLFQAAVNDVHGRIVDGPMKGKTPTGKLVAKITYNVPLISAGAIAESFKSAGNVEGQKESKNTKAPEGKLALAQFVVKLYDTEPFVPNDEGFGTQLRNGASVSLRGLSMTVSFLLATILFVGPWVVLLWIGYRLTRRFWPANEVVAGERPQPAEPAKT